jgi:hypothetical protein
MKIKGGKGEPPFIIINVADFDESLHEVYTEPATKPVEDLGSGNGSESTGNSGDGSDSDSNNESSGLQAVELTRSQFLKLSKADMVVRVRAKGISVVPDDLNKEQIADLYFGE